MAQDSSFHFHTLDDHKLHTPTNAPQYIIYNISCNNQWPRLANRDPKLVSSCHTNYLAMQSLCEIRILCNLQLFYILSLSSLTLTQCLRPPLPLPMDSSYIQTAQAFWQNPTCHKIIVPLNLRGSGPPVFTHSPLGKHQDQLCHMCTTAGIYDNVAKDINSITTRIGATTHLMLPPLM